MLDQVRNAGILNYCMPHKHFHRLGPLPYTEAFCMLHLLYFHILYFYEKSKQVMSSHILILFPFLLLLLLLLPVLSVLVVPLVLLFPLLLPLLVVLAAAATRLVHGGSTTSTHIAAAATTAGSLHCCPISLVFLLFVLSLGGCVGEGTVLLWQGSGMQAEAGELYLGQWDQFFASN